MPLQLLTIMNQMQGTLGTPVCLIALVPLQVLHVSEQSRYQDARTHVVR